MALHSRETAYQQRLAETLGTFFADTWITNRKDDGLVNFCFDEGEFVCMEFMRSGFIEFHWRDLPPPFSFQSTDPAAAWTAMLKACDGEEIRAIATLLFEANENMADQTSYLHIDSGSESFLSALCLEDS